MEKIGFTCGIEIHQQLETRKLFCHCPSIVHDANPEITVFRKLRASAGETGETDVAAAFEQKRDRGIIYEACKGSSCLVELDEEPPHPMNPEAVQIALGIAKLLNADIVDEIQVMRKTVVDGSNTSGFQRTALVATNGHIDTAKGRVRIPTICLEEEAAKRIRDDKSSVTFRLDRLGVALIEIATETDIRDPDHAQEVARELGMILRSTGMVKRGIGTIRQDVNISIKGGARTEVKGFQDLRSIPVVIRNEIKRQQKLIRQGKKLSEEVRRANSDGTTTFLRPLPGAARMYPETDIPPVVPVIGKTGKTELIRDKIERISKKYNVPEDLVGMAARYKINIERYLDKYDNLKAVFIIETITSKTKEIRRKFRIDIDLNDPEDKCWVFLDKAFGEMNKGSISTSVMPTLLEEYAKGNAVDFAQYAQIDEKELRKILEKVMADNQGIPFNGLIGRAMAVLRGKADGKRVVEILRELAKCS
ncbi:MAG: Glu-tRNA(Gln) amidotransferase subunit GatE [archaeon]